MDELSLIIREAKSDGCTLKCRVQPRSSRNKLLGVYDGALKVALTAPPVEGKANAELIAFWAEFFDVSKSSVFLESGQTSKTKLFAIKGIDAVAARRRVADRLE